MRDWTALLGCLNIDVAKSRTEKQWPLFFCSFGGKSELSDGKTSALGLETTGTIRGVNVIGPGHMPVPMERRTQ